MSPRARLVGDVGGTNARFALVGADGVPEPPTVFPTGGHPTLVAAVRAFLDARGSPALESAAIAVANPVTGDLAKLTNNDWSFSISATRDALGLDVLHVVNDFTALALSVPYLPADEREQVGRGEARPRHAIAVLGPGTGLGVSGLVPCGERWSALAGEGGHVSFAPQDARERELLARLAARFDHVSLERLLSGPGLVNVATALREIDALEPVALTPAEITARAASGQDPVCVETLELFCRALGACAGDLVLSLGAEGGCYVGGGIVPRLGERFARSGFRAAFEAKGRMRPYLERIPTFVIRSPWPALAGAARLLA